MRVEFPAFRVDIDRRLVSRPLKNCRRITKASKVKAFQRRRHFAAKCGQHSEQYYAMGKLLRLCWCVAQRHPPCGPFSADLLVTATFIHEDAISLFTQHVAFRFR